MVGRFNSFVLVALAQFFLAGSAMGAERYAVVASDTIYPGQIITADTLQAIKLIRKPAVRYRFVRRFDEIVGLQASRTILAGRFIRLDSAHPAPLVKAGTRARVHFEVGGLAISLLCVSLSDGVEGQDIRVRNPTSGKIIIARVMKDGTLVVKDL